MEFAKEKKRHLAYLSKIRPRPLEQQNVLTYSVQQFPEETTRLEYMSFVEENQLKHSWAAMLAWWRFRQHTDTDKSVRTAIKRTMELKKREEYTIISTCRKHRKTQSPPPQAVAASPTKQDDDDNTTEERTTTPPPPSPPPKKKDTNDNIILQKLILQMSPSDWYEFMLTHDEHIHVLADVRKFLHTKYIHEENTCKRDHYGRLCNIAEYPLCFRPYEEDFSAKRKLTFDPNSVIDQAKCNKPDTFINRPFSGSVFPAYMSREEYVYNCSTPHDVLLPSYVDNSYEQITVPPSDPVGLYRINEVGKMVQVL